MQVGLLVTEDQVRLADDSDDLLSESTTAIAPLSVFGEKLDRGAGVLLASDGRHVGVHDLGGGLHRGSGYSTGAAWKQPAAIESITSVGDHRLGGADPGRPPRPARAWARTAAQAAANGSRPRASSAAVIPRARRRFLRSRGPGAESTLTATRSPSVTIVSSPLSTTTAPAAGGLAGAGEPVGGDSSEPRSSRRPSSPACGVRTVGASRAAIALELAGERVQTVGVEDQRRLDRGRAPRGPARPSRGRVPGRARGRRRQPPRRRAGPPSTRPARGSRRPRGSRPTSPRAARPRRSPRGRPARRRSRSRPRRGSPPGRTSAQRRSGRANRRRSQPVRS